MFEDGTGHAHLESFEANFPTVPGSVRNLQSAQKTWRKIGRRKGYVVTEGPFLSSLASWYPPGCMCVLNYNPVCSLCIIVVHRCRKVPWGFPHPLLSQSITITEFAQAGRPFQLYQSLCLSFRLLLGFIAGILNVVNLQDTLALSPEEEKESRCDSVRTGLWKWMSGKEWPKWLIFSDMQL